MSVQAITWALEQACSTATEKAVLLVVANYVGPDGTTFVGQETIAAQACCSVKTVERSLSAFEALGWIIRERRHRRNGSRTSDLIVSIGPKHPERRENDLTDAKSARPPNRQPVQKTKQTSSPNLPDCVSGPTTFEPLEEPSDAVVASRKPANDLPAVVLTVVSAIAADDWPEGDARVHADLLIAEASTCWLDPSRQPGLVTTTGRIHAWRRDGASWAHDILPVVVAIAQRQRKPIGSWKFFDGAIAQSIADNRAALSIPEANPHAGQAHDRISASQSARRENRDRASAGADWASEVMASRRAL